MVGQTVSHYRILEKLGGGGMGVVYKAIDLRLNRLVALKFLSPELTRNREASERFRREAQAASALDHPNICTIHEIDETPAGESFLALAYYGGETLKKRIERGPLPLVDALDIAIQVARGLSRAHQSGIVHRDIKPANVMLTSDGLAKIVDFGIAKLTAWGEGTTTGATLGTVAYMSPEQARGQEVDGRSDVWGLGVVLYEMVTGSRPFTGKDDVAILASILGDTPTPVRTLREGVPPGLERIVSRALEKNPAARYGSAGELLDELTSCHALITESGPKGADVLRLLRRPLVAAAVAAILVVAAVSATIAYRRSASVRWAREEAIPQIERFIRADDLAAAFALAREVERITPNDPILVGLWPQFSAAASVITVPEAADVYVQEYAATGERWEHLGSTPIKNLRLPRGVFRFRIEKEGFEPQIVTAVNPSSVLRNATSRLASPITISLPRTGDASEMVPVPGGAFPVALSRFNTNEMVQLDSFWMDRYEVTNKAFKTFVDAGGYSNPEYWRALPFVKDGRQLTWQEAREYFRDSTDRPGPATWEIGQYPTGQDDYPVSGVSWYEAAAYCRSEGKTLPTLFHWARAALSADEMSSPLAPAIIPASNFAGNGSASVGRFRGIGPYGTYDMGGNVREWAWNEAAGGRRWILGGAWNDPDWMLIQRNFAAPFDRSATNGFRCARYGSDRGLREELVGLVETPARDYRTATAVSNEVFKVFERQYRYAKSALNERVEASDASNRDWVREKVSFDAGYEKTRVPAYLFLPRGARPPYQAVVFFPGLTAFAGRASSDSLQPGLLDFVVRSGRALLWPIYKGSYERWDPFLNLQGEESSRALGTRMIQWRQELGNAIDVLAARKEIDITQIAYVGGSFGASMPLPLLALEDRLKTAVLLAPGFTFREMPPEADAVNFVSHVTLPVLMIGGRHDYVLPLEESQKPLFERLGSPGEHKRHVIFDAGHGADYPRSEMIREVLAWLDRYLGPVPTSAR